MSTTFWMWILQTTTKNANCRHAVTMAHNATLSTSNSCIGLSLTSLLPVSNNITAMLQWYIINRTVMTFFFFFYWSANINVVTLSTMPQKLVYPFRMWNKKIISFYMNILNINNLSGELFTCLCWNNTWIKQMVLITNDC